MTAEMAQGVSCGVSCDKGCGSGVAVLCELKRRFGVGEQEVLGKLCKHEVHSLYVHSKSIQQ